MSVWLIHDNKTVWICLFRSHGIFFIWLGKNYVKDKLFKIRMTHNKSYQYISFWNFYALSIRRNKGKLLHIACKLFSIIIQKHQTNVTTANASPFMKPTLTQWGAYITKRFWPVHQQEDFVEPTQPCLYRTNGSSWYHLEEIKESYRTLNASYSQSLLKYTRQT